MKTLDMAKAMLHQATDRLATAETAYSNGNYPYTVRSAQECVELTLKATLRAVGVEYPKKHDVSRVLLRVRDRLPPSFPADDFARISKNLVELREPAMYGDELRMISSSALFGKKQAGEVLGKARKVHEACAAFIQAFGSTEA